MTEHPGWQGILDDDERILWQGRPEPGLRIGASDLRDALPALFALAFLLFWLTMALSVGGGFMFIVVGLIAFCSVTYKLFRALFLPAWGRARSWYTLTDRRAIVASDIPFQGRRLVSYQLDAGSMLEYVAGDPPSILFGPVVGDPRDRPGFRFIKDADQVMALLRRIQRREYANPQDDGFDKAGQKDFPT